MLSQLKIDIQSIPHETAKHFIEAHHYSKKYPQAVKYRFGLFLDTKLVGAAVFSVPSNRYSFTSALKDFDQSKGVELSRFFTYDGLPKNFETFCLKRCFDYIKNDGIDAILSYADETFGHTGALYKALNGIYLGKTAPEVRYRYNGQYITRRGLGRAKGDTEAEHRKRILADGATKELSKPKHKFLWILNNKKRLRRSLKGNK